MSSDGIFKQIEALLSKDMCKGYFEGITGQTNFFAQNGINVTTRTLFNEQYGLRTAIFNEESAGLPNHYMYKLTDALALGDAIAKLDNSFDIKEMNVLFDQGAYQTKASLEGILDGLRKTIFGDVALTPVGDVGESSDSRKNYYINLKAFSESVATLSLTGKFTIVSSVASATQARNDLASFVSLYYLTPFILTPKDAGATDTLYQLHAAIADKWNDDRNLTATQIANGEAHYSDMYLADRAAMLSWVNKANKDDSNYSNISGLDAAFMDDATDINLGNTASLGVSKYHFGDQGSNNLAGGNDADHLYGQRGADTFLEQIGDVATWRIAA